MPLSLTEENTFDISTHKDSLHVFPQISYDEFEEIDELDVRRDIVEKNKLLRTDAYNRTMAWLKGNEKSLEKETYTLTFRRSPNNEYNVVHGIRKLVKYLLEYPILQHELDFAADALAAQAERGGNSHFDKELWQKVIDENDGYLPIKIRAVEDGTILRPGEPAMSIE
jgi:nicotinic acid phosphoribosyltransferase